MSGNTLAKSEPNRDGMKFKFDHNLRIVTILAFLSAAVLFAAAPASTQGSRGNDPQRTEFVDGHEAVAGEALVKFRDSATQEGLAQVGQAVDADVVERVSGAGIYLIHSRSKDAATLVKELSAREDVLYAEPNYIFYTTDVPNDPQFAQLWGLQNIGQTIQGVPGVPGADISAVSAWDITTGSRNNVVGVADTGINYNHTDLADNVWSAPAQFTVKVGGQNITCPEGSHGFNAINNSCDPLDDHGHGTHVSGTVGAVGNNGVGVVGVNQIASIMGLKICTAGGSCPLANAIKAIDFAIQVKAIFADSGGANVRVLNNSWGGTVPFSQAMLDAINLANDNDMLFVAAAGNQNRNIDSPPNAAFYPAGFNAPNVLAVASTDNRDLRSSFSNFGPNTVHLGAPGSNVYSTLRTGGYGFMSGTSMASPHVAGAAALVLSACSLNTAGLKSNLVDNVDPIPSMANITISGGRLNVNRAILACSKGGGFTLTAAPSKVSRGDLLTVTWIAPNGRSSLDWIGLYRVGDSNFDFTWWEYTGGATSGSFTTIAPSKPGQYEFRYLLDDGYTSVRQSNVVTVN